MTQASCRAPNGDQTPSSIDASSHERGRAPTTPLPPEAHPDRTSVLLVAGDGPAERSLLRALKKRGLDSEWVKTAADLKLRAGRDDSRAPGVVFLDLGLSDPAGEDLILLLRSRFPSAAVVALGADLNGEHAARLLSVGVPSLNKPVSPVALAELAPLLARDHARSRQQPRNETNGVNGSNGSSETNGAHGSERAKGSVGHLEAALESYALNRALSQQQRLILRFYLSGDNDKEIAHICSCSEATVYEHWRRMGRKAGGSTKADVIADFHRFLVGH